MDLFDDKTRLFSYEVKEAAGFHKGGEKNFEGTIADLQMHTYLCMRDFKKRKNKSGVEYGWDVAIYAKPEELYGYKHVTRAYSESPVDSYKKIEAQVLKFYPDADLKSLKKLMDLLLVRLFIMVRQMERLCLRFRDFSIVQVLIRA